MDSPSTFSGLLRRATGVLQNLGIGWAVGEPSAGIVSEANLEARSSGSPARMGK